jgi:hypothetical protein
MATAAQQRRYRAAAAARGRPVPRGRSGRSGKRVPLFDTGRFVAVDGEGFNVGTEIVKTIGVNNRQYRTHEHHYALLAASDGSEVYSASGRLTTKQCLDFLIDIKINDPLAIIVCFGGSYDMTHMLAFGLSRDEIEMLLHGDGTRMSRKVVDVTLTDANGSHDYRLEMRPRKSLSVWRWEAGAAKYERHRRKDGSTTWRMAKCDKAVMWDVWGFFQGTFAGAMQQWLHGDKDYEFIRAMKGQRSLFERSEIETVRRYNQAELRCLVTMMDKVRAAIGAMGLSISRWDGAGAIAGALLRHHGIKDHMATSPPDVFDAACHAYSGGHIEATKIGHHDGAVHHYDINSAYPDQFRNLPSLSRGTWHRGETQEPPPGFTMVRVEYRFKPGLPFYPLFYRQSNGSILYPERGHGWHWFPEFDVARRFAAAFGSIEFRVVQWWHFASESNQQPFGFINDLYERRKTVVEETKRTGIPNGEEKTLKLGYNSIYGKAAQQVGARWENGEIVPPAYFQIEYAGYVTAGCRAKIMEAAMQNPTAIISFATDGLFTTDALNLDTPKTKELGAWEYQQHSGMTIVMPGIYWLHDEKKPITHYSRGFDKDAMKEDDFVRRAWARKQTSIDVKSRRMITLGTALMSDNFWEMRGLFTETDRNLTLSGDNSKRCPVAMHDKKLHKSLYPSFPQDLMEDYDLPLSGLLSESYPIIWLREEETPENSINAEMTDADRSFHFDSEAMVLA